MLIPQEAGGERSGPNGVVPGHLAELRCQLADPSALDDGNRQRLLELGHRLDRIKALGDGYERVGLSQREHALPNVLSAGERQRVAIARALANEPRILLADEPTGALDSKNGERLLELLDELQRDARTTLVVVTHDPQVAARAGRVLDMLDGRITSPQAARTSELTVRAPMPFMNLRRER